MVRSTSGSRSRSPTRSRSRSRSKRSEESRSPSPAKNNIAENSDSEGSKTKSEGKLDENASSPVKADGDRKSRSRSRSRRRQRSGSGGDRPRTRSRTGSPRSRSRSRSRSRGRNRGGRSFSPRRRRSPIDEDGYRIHVADLDVNGTKRDLEKVFGKFGPLKEIWMARSVPCFAFVVYRYKEDAEDAVRLADNTEICGRRIRVTHARPRTKGRGRRGFDPNMRCYQCGDRGHFSRDCPDTKYGYKRPPSPRYRGGGGGGSARDDRYHSYDRYDRRSRY